MAAMALGVLLAWYAYSTGPEKVLWATGAEEVTDPATDQQRQLVNVVEEMAIAAGVPRPQIWIVSDPDPNAFATGRERRHAHVAVTQGLLDLCSRDELQAVIAHELGHVKNLDVRLMTTLAALVGAVLLMRDGATRIFVSPGSGRIGGSGGGGGRGGRKNLGPLVAVLLVVWIVSWILAPIISQLLALAVSRKREYLADAMGAQFTRNPLALASALQKSESADAPTTHIKQGAAHLCIADPLGRRLTSHEGFLADLLATHPPMAKRITILRGMGYAALKKEGGALAGGWAPPPRPPHDPRVPGAPRALPAAAAAAGEGGAQLRSRGARCDGRPRPRARHLGGAGASPRGTVHHRDRPAAQRPLLLQARLQPRQDPGEPPLQGERRLPGRGGPRADPQAGRRGLPHEPPLQRRLCRRGLRARAGGARELRRRGVGPRLAARVRVQVVRGLLRAPPLPRTAVPRGAGAVRAADHEERRHAGNLSRGRPHAARAAPSPETRPARLHLSHRARPRVR